jgi:hypothetical protein
VGWQLGGYHLRLQLLESARYARDFDNEVRERMVEVLNELDTRYHVMLSTLHMEVLARYGQIEPIRTLEDIQAEIADVLAGVDDPEKQISARGIVGAIFDDEEIVGPYGEAIYSLPEERRLDLFAMSVLASGFSVAYELAMKELAEHAKNGSAVVRRAVEEAARMVRSENVIRQEAVGGHLLGLRGWAKISAALPAAAAKPDDPGEAAYAAVWRLVDALLFTVLRADDAAAPTDIAGRDLT